MALPAIFILGTIESVLRTPLGGLFENAVLLNLVVGESVHYSVGTWKKGKGTDIEADFIMDVLEFDVKFPIECKAVLKLKKNHYKNIFHYLKITGLDFGVVVSVAPLERCL